MCQCIKDAQGKDFLEDNTYEMSLVARVVVRLDSRVLLQERLGWPAATPAFLLALNPLTSRIQQVDEQELFLKGMA